MSNQELVEAMLVRVRHGLSIPEAARLSFGSPAMYYRKVETSDRKRIRQARIEYKLVREKPKKKRNPRFIACTTRERLEAMHTHCRENGISYGRFINAAIAEKLERARKRE